MFPRRMSWPEVYMSCRFVSSSMSQFNVTLEDVAVLGECCPSGRDSSLNLNVLVFVSGDVSLSQIYVALTVLDLRLLTCTGVSFSIITFIFDLFIFIP